jgi:hypothetical protein
LSRNLNLSLSLIQSLLTTRRQAQIHSESK